MANELWHQRLRDIRDKVGLSQEDMADRLGVPYRTYQNYEQGKTTPKMACLSALSGLGIDINWLFTGDGEMFRVAPGLPTQTQSQSQATPPAEPPVLDAELMGLIVEGISGTYKEAGAAIAPRHLGELATRLHADVLASVAGDDDPGARRAALRALLIQLRRDLASTDAATQAKRQA